MKYTLKWLWRAWPALTFFVFVAAHWGLVFCFPCLTAEIHKATSFLCQTGGVGFMLYAVNANLRLFDRRQVFDLAVQWWKERPRLWGKGKSFTLEIQSGMHRHFSGNASLQLRQAPSSLEDLATQLMELEKRMVENHEELSRRIESVRAEANAATEGHRIKVDDLEAKVKDGLAGDVRLQLLAASLAFYGAVAGLLT